MSIYDIDHDIVIAQQVPVRNRKPRRLAWLRAIATGIKAIYNSFMAYRENKLYFLAHNSQVCYMEAALNDAFDNDMRRIYIDDGVFHDPLYVYMEPEERPVMLALDSELPIDEEAEGYAAPVFLVTNVETWPEVPQFIVFYPADLGLNIPRLKALVDRYRLPSKHRYLLQEF